MEDGRAKKKRGPAEADPHPMLQAHWLSRDEAVPCGSAAGTE